MPSSVIAALHYHASEQALDIVYCGGRGRYRYFGVPPEEYKAFRAAPSQGTYLNEIFKIRGYRYQRLGSRGAAPRPVNGGAA